MVQIAPGELLDKITVLQSKSEHVDDAEMLWSVRRELAVLAAARARSVPTSADLDNLAADLKAVNESLWQIDDAASANKTSGRASWNWPACLTGHRAALKQDIDDLFSSPESQNRSAATQAEPIAGASWVETPVGGAFEKSRDW